jgi:hypothetical protein
MEINYQGNELDLFAKAINWKKYFASFIKPYLQGKVIEVGAGKGGHDLPLLDRFKAERGRPALSGPFC